MENYKLIKKDDRWLCKWKDADGKFHQKICFNCKSKKDAESFVDKLSNKDDQYLYKNIASQMYLEGSPHIKRLEMFGKKLTNETIKQKRSHIEFFLKRFGNRDIRSTRISEIELYLMNDSHSGSFKNNVLDTIGTIYEETIWKCDIIIPKPKFQRFSRNSKKADVFDEWEMELILSKKTWENYEHYLIFNLIAACGLRISELRAVRPCQFLWKEKILIVDGFCKTNGERTNYNKKGSEENRKLRVVPLSDKIIRLYRKYIADNSIADGQLIFTREDGTPPRRETLEALFKRTLPKIGIKIGKRKLVPHSLRYTYVTQMSSMVDLEKVRKMVGHNSIAMTEYYNRFSLNSEIRSVQEAFPAVNKLYE